MSMNRVIFSTRVSVIPTVQEKAVRQGRCPHCKKKLQTVVESDVKMKFCEWDRMLYWWGELEKEDA